MTDSDKDLSQSRGYSLPVSMHEQIAREAKSRGWNSSHLIREAIRLWLRVNSDSSEKKAS